MRWFLCPWEALSRDALYGILQLRADVFVVEQTCAYLDLDGRDAEAVHLWAEDDRGVAACARILPGPVIGRVVTRADLRGTGVGYALMERALQACPAGEATVHLSAQAHLEGFYRTFGFAVSGPGYLEDGIPHVPMDAAGSPRARGFERLRVAEARFRDEVPAVERKEGWGTGETAEHLARVAAIFRMQIANQTEAWTNAPNADSDAHERAFALLEALRSSQRFESPEAVLPRGEPVGVEGTTAALGKALSGIPEAADNRLLVRHPFAGNLTIPALLNFLAAHCDHHRKALLRRAVPFAP